MIATLKNKISLSKKDARKFISKLARLRKKTLIYFDPPYYLKGKHLYYNYYTHKEHEDIAGAIRKEISEQKWIVSYDDVSQIRRMYRGYRSRTYSLNYSAREACKGEEVMFFCNDMNIPPVRKFI